MNDMNQDFGPDRTPTAAFHVPVPRRRWSRKWMAALAAGVVVVAGGGGYAVARAAVGSPAAPAAASTSSAVTQAAALRDVVTSSAKGARRLARLRLLGGMYGQFTYQTKKGPSTLAYERGTVISVGDGDVVVRAKDGVSQTWLLTGTSVVRENGTKEPEGTLAPGQPVFVGGPVTAGARDARLIVIRKKAAGTTSTSSSAA